MAQIKGKVTEVGNKFQWKDQDGNLKWGIECNFMEVGEMQDSERSRWNQTLWDANADKVAKDQVWVCDFVLKRKSINKRDGGTFLKTEPTFYNAQLEG